MMKRNNERGIAIVISLFLMTAMSVLAASLMFLAQSETYASMNYRMMSQARYAGEAAVQKASDFLLDDTQYIVPSAGSAIDPVGVFDRDESPVEYLGAPVVLSAWAGKASNYPAGSVQTAFAAAAQGAITAGTTPLTYGAYATLIAMQQFDAYGGTQGVVQTWEITGVGGLTGPRPATVEVVAVVETRKVPANNYAAFATANTCGAMYFHGNVTVDSYDSRVPGGPAASLEEDGGDVGTNGNLQIAGSVEVQGNLYTPRTGVGTCEEGAVTALTETGSADVTGSIIQLPTAVTYPLPVFSVTPPYNQTVTIDSPAALAGACATLALADASVVPGVNCFTSGTTITLGADGLSADITLPNISIAGGYTLIIEGNSSPGQSVNINSLTGTGDVEIEANTDAGDANESVILKVAGKAADGVAELAVPFDLSQMAWKQNSAASSYDASALQIVYGGSAAINMKGGNSQSAVTIYAPNAAFELQGTQDLFGSVLARTVTNAGNAGIHYDRRLASDFWVAGRPMVASFTWSLSDE